MEVRDTVKIDWVNTILTIIGAVVGSAVAGNISAIGDLIPVAGTSVGEIIAIVVGGGLGSAVAGALGGRGAATT
jgi:hypothetical protein